MMLNTCGMSFDKVSSQFQQGWRFLTPLSNVFVKNHLVVGFNKRMNHLVYFVLMTVCICYIHSLLYVILYTRVTRLNFIFKRKHLLLSFKAFCRKYFRDN